jgi:hypothetical protein
MWKAWVPDGLNLSWGTPAPIGGSLSDARGIMMVMRVLLEELLC